MIRDVIWHFIHLSMFYHLIWNLSNGKTENLDICNIAWFRVTYQTKIYKTEIFPVILLTKILYCKHARLYKFRGKLHDGIEFQNAWSSSISLPLTKRTEDRPTHFLQGRISSRPVELSNVFYFSPTMASQRKFFVGGNWKMNGNKASIDGIIQFLNAGPLDPNTGETNSTRKQKRGVTVTDADDGLLFRFQVQIRAHFT